MAKINQVLATGSSFVDDLLTANKWSSNVVSFGFTGSAQQYSSGYGRGEAQNGFKPLSNQQQDAAKDAFVAWSSVADIDFVLTDATQAEIRLGGSSMPRTAWAYSPSEAEFSGDVWIGAASFNARPDQGNYAFFTVMHEIGHALGLGHPHDAQQIRSEGAPIGDALEALCPCCAGAIHNQTGQSVTPISASASNTPDKGIDAMAYSVMSYRSYSGADISAGYQNESFGYSQSLMVRDIAAIQHLYGANYTTNSTDTVYHWNETSGEKFINGRGQGAPGANKVFETLWDGGGVDTLDLTNFESDLKVDLAPGGWTNFGTSQLARLGAGQMAPGNVANALLHENDVRSLIENAISGAGDDLLIGNRASNILVGGAGSDTIYGAEGNDILVGGHLGNALQLIDLNTDVPAVLRLAALAVDGDDKLVGGDGNDILITGSGSNQVDGGTGSDTIIISVNFDDIVIEQQQAGKHLITFDGGSIVAENVEFIVLNDGIYSLGNSLGDLDPTARDIALLYSAALDRDLDLSGYEYWTGVVQNGGSLLQIAGALIDSPEFISRFGHPEEIGNKNFVGLLYQNVLDREGDSGGWDYWTSVLNNGISQSEVLLAFSQSAENVAASVPEAGEGVNIISVTETQWAMFAA